VFLLGLFYFLKLSRTVQVYILLYVIFYACYHSLIAEQSLMMSSVWYKLPTHQINTTYMVLQRPRTRLPKCTTFNITAVDMRRVRKNTLRTASV